MSAAEHLELAALAQELILEEGRSTTFNQLAATAADPAKPWRGPGAQEVGLTRTLPAVFLPVASGSDLGFFAKDDDLLHRAEQVVLVAPADVDLRTMNQLVDGDVTLTVQWVRVLEPGQHPILYAFGVTV